MIVIHMSPTNVIFSEQLRLTVVFKNISYPARSSCNKQDGMTAMIDTLWGPRAAQQLLVNRMAVGSLGTLEGADGRKLRTRALIMQTA